MKARKLITISNNTYNWNKSILSKEINIAKYVVKLEIYGKSFQECRLSFIQGKLAQLFPLYK